MKSKIHLTILGTVCAVLMISSCNDSTKLFSNPEEFAIMQSDFETRRADIDNPELFSIFETELTQEQRDALTFLYAYMPLSDIADYSGEYFLENVEYAFRAKEEMPWGKDIPEREWRHFVLPVRVNNEDLDNCRPIFYEELKDRIKDLSLYDAVLEVNHWCHEKVTYTPSDSRTSSPLASIKTAYGRCGEESTLTVAALRAVGIPARQVYTPRWAHTDDNHAWVEAWVDGQWYFLGACEPAAVLDFAWFNAPASRGMLMHTEVFGRYNGPEEVILRTPLFTEINVIDNYAPTADMDIFVTSSDGQAAEDAKVEFKLYNYAEFYSVATKTTDAEGHAFLTAGLGDMMVWASKDRMFGYAKASFGKDKSITIVLDNDAQQCKGMALDIDITPPSEGANVPYVSPERQAETDRRLAQEDSIRAAYEATFMNEEKSSAVASALGIDAKTLTPLLVGSRGNHAVIVEFLTALDPAQRADGIDLLRRISEKDLRDVTLDVLNDHIATPLCSDPRNFSEYVRNPRVEREMIVPYKSFFRNVVSPDQMAAYQADPLSLVKWVEENIRIDNDCNIGGTRTTPIGVWKARMADERSRDIFFVSLARSMGIPARIDPVTGKVQLLDGKETADVDFKAAKPIEQNTGRLVLSYSPVRSLDNPKYYYHFTISRLTGDGTLELLSYKDGESWETLFKNGISMDEGNYVLVSGTRLAKGGVLSHIEFFTISKGKTVTVPLVMRESLEEVQVIGSFNSENRYRDLLTGNETSVLSTTGRGYFAVAVLGTGGEPTNHALRDIAAMKDEFEAWGRSFIMLFPSEEQARRFKPEDFPGLPSTVSYGIDTDGHIQQEIIGSMKLQNASLPVVIIADTFNRVVFVSQGYTIGLGEQMMKTAGKL